MSSSEGPGPAQVPDKETRCSPRSKGGEREGKTDRREKQSRNPVGGEEGEAGSPRSVCDHRLPVVRLSGALWQEGRPTLPPMTQFPRDTSATIWAASLDTQARLSLLLALGLMCRQR